MRPGGAGGPEGRIDGSGTRGPVRRPSDNDPSMEEGAAGGGCGAFQHGRVTSDPEADAARIKDLHAKIDELTVEQDFLADGLRRLPGRSGKR